MSFNVPIQQDVDVILSGATVNLPGAITASGDVGVLRQSPSGDLLVTGSLSLAEGVIFRGFGDSPALDAFSRLRVSNPSTQLDSKQLFDNQPLIWSDLVTSGSVVYNTNRASSTLQIGGDSDAIVARQTKQRVNYQPGKSLLVMCTFVFGTGAFNVRKRVGYFDSKNGIFLQQNNSVLSVGIRSNYSGTPVDSMVNQVDWNLDPLNGTGPSGISFDATKAQIFIADLEWLGVGRVRVGFVVNGTFVYVHEFNLVNTLTGVYMSSPNLPIRYEIANIGVSGGGSLEQICSTVISEGGYTEIGSIRGVSRDSTPMVIAQTNGEIPLISVRLKQAYIGTTILPLDFTIIGSTASTYHWKLILNPTIAGSDAVVWNNMQNSAMQYDISRTTANSASNGTVIKSGYIAGQGNSINVATAGDLSSQLIVSADINDVQDQLVLTLKKIDNGSASYYASISWREIP